MMKSIKNYWFILIILLYACKDEDARQPSFSQSTSDNQPKEKPYNAKNIGDTLDVFNNVYVFYNKNFDNTSVRHLTDDNYNLGLKWQCVEFVKRYYYEHFNHKMPNSYGHAKDFFNADITDGKRNSDRNLLQFTNGSVSKPKVDDMVIFDGTLFNPYGHVAIISSVSEDKIEIVQQNVGKKSRDNLQLHFKNQKWIIVDDSVLGWLRKDD